MSPIRYYDRRRAPLIKRLSGLAVFLLFLGLIADVHLLAQQNQRRIDQVQREQTCHPRRHEKLSAMCDAVSGLIQIRDAVAAGKPLTAEQVQQIIDRVQQGPRGPRGPAGPRGASGTPGTIVTTTSGSSPTTRNTTTSSTRPATTTTTRTCLLILCT